MIVYHGSNHNFEKLKIVKRNTKNSSLLNEGYGIYFNLNPSVASTYGKYLYTIEISDMLVLDFRKLSTCNTFISMLIYEIYKNTEVNIGKYLDNKLIENLRDGNLAVNNIDKEIYLVLDNTEEYYMRYTDTQREHVKKFLNKYKNEVKAYLFSYNIENTGIIKDVSIANIIDKRILRPR